MIAPKNKKQKMSCVEKIVLGCVNSDLMEARLIGKRVTRSVQSILCPWAQIPTNLARLATESQHNSRKIDGIDGSAEIGLGIFARGKCKLFLFVERGCSSDCTHQSCAGFCGVSGIGDGGALQTAFRMPDGCVSECEMDGWMGCIHIQAKKLTERVNIECSSIYMNIITKIVTK